MDVHRHDDLAHQGEAIAVPHPPRIWTKIFLARTGLSHST